jgi:excisionase family DNA binding protein
MERNQKDGPELLDTERLANALSVSPATVRAWVSRLDVPCVRIGRLVRFRLGDVLDWIDRADPSLRRARSSSDSAAR